MKIKMVRIIILLLVIIHIFTSCTINQAFEAIKGEKCESGKDGISISKTEINDNGELIITLSDGTVANLGVITGSSGADGTNGKDGADGLPGVTPLLRINEETYYWEVSYDEGKNWISLEVKAKAEDEDSGKNNETPSTNTSHSSWRDASVTFVGDSITAGVGTNKTYCNYLDEIISFEKIVNMGVAGSCISAMSDYGNNNLPLINRYKSIPKSDLIVLFMGTNDYGHETPLGTIEDTTDTSFYGALNIIIPGILSMYPNSQLIVITPLHRYGFGSSKITKEPYTYDYIPNGRGHNLNDYVDALRKVCERWSVPVIDLFSNSSINPALPAIKNIYMPDGLHPNEKGHERISQIISAHLELYPKISNSPDYSEPNYNKPDYSDYVSLQHGNKFVSNYAQDTSRASSSTNIYLKAGQVVSIVDTDQYKWALAGTTDANSSIKTHGYYPESSWSSVQSYTVQKDGYYGVVIMKNNNEIFVFDEDNDSDNLFDYIIVQ